MELLVRSDGTVRGIYAEEIDLGLLGCLSITRASHVEPDDKGHWITDLSPVKGPVLGPFDHRSDALQAEHSWLVANWLTTDH